jgi:putative ABC transport system permease protein
MKRLGDGWLGRGEQDGLILWEGENRMSELAVAMKMLWHNRSRLVLTLLGIGVTFFLSAAQIGILVGWCNTTSALVRNSGVDVWVMARQTPAFDYGTPIPRNRVYQLRSLPGVAWAEGLTMSWNIWQRADGRKVNVELVGLDESCAGGPWHMKRGDVEGVHGPHTVVVDQLYLEMLGVRALGDEAELMGQRAVVGGISGEVRTFTASPFIFTSIQSAVRYDQRYRDDEITYVLVRCANGSTPEAVRDEITREVPSVEALTTRQFAVRTMKYWMLETGAGISIVLTAILGLAVGGIIGSQTLAAITQDHLSHYATLLALGFSRGQLALIVAMQGLGLGTGGISLGALGFCYAAQLSAPTPIPLQTTAFLFSALIGASLCCCLLASLVSIRSLFKIDPITVFRS